MRYLACCLPGDLRPDCIGVYKIPITEDPVEAQKFIPEYNNGQATAPAPIAPPRSVDQAWEVLQNQRNAVVEIAPLVQTGKLQEAGIQVLQAVPPMSVSSKVILDDLSRNVNTGGVLGEMTVQKVETQWNIMIASWGETDVMLGQGLRGDMGVSAVAQIQILKQLEESIGALDDFMAAAGAASGRKR